MKELEKITIKSLSTWENHDDYPELTFVLNDSQPWCESCCQVDYGTPIAMTHTNWCLNCLYIDRAVSEEDSEMIWKASEKYE
jgi:hypothetical protein